MRTFGSIQMFRQRCLRVIPFAAVLALMIIYVKNDVPQSQTNDRSDLSVRHLVQSSMNPTKRKIMVYKAKASDPYNWDPTEIHPPELLTDTGGRRCQEAKRNIRMRASVIIDADHQTVSQVNFTIHNILQASRVSIGQFLVVCDGTVSQDEAKSLGKYLQENVPRSSLLHVRETGRPRSQHQAARKASEDVLVFMQAGVWVAQGWLDPMIDFLQDNGSSIAFPRYDVVHFMNERVPIYKKLYYVRTSILSWDLTSRLMTEFNFEDIMPTMNSAGLRGDVWAIRKDYWDKIGGFDEYLLDGGGAYTELAIRVWLCGGTVRAVSCARVAIPDTTSITIETKNNLEYIVSKWMPDEIKRVSAASGEHLAVRNSYKTVHENLQCSMSMEEYMAFLDVEHILYAPSVDQNRNQQRNRTNNLLLQSETGGCVMHLDNGNIVLEEDCGGTDNSRALFELSPDGYLMHVMTSLCLTVTSNHQVRLEACLDMELRQQWDLRDDGTMISILLQYDCLQHKTHKTTGEQVALLGPCLPPFHKDKEFERWQWIAVPANSTQFEGEESLMH